MFSVKTLLTIVLLVRRIDSNEELNQSYDKRRLPTNVERYKWTTTTAKPDEVYIEPLGDIRDLCIRMLEKYRFSDGEYVWRPYNSRLYGELRWKKKKDLPFPLDIDQRAREIRV